MKHTFTPSLCLALLAFTTWLPVAHSADSPTTAPYVSKLLVVEGAVKQPLTLTVEDLQRFPPQKISEVEMICASGARLGTKQNLRGVLLRDILEAAHPRAVEAHDFRKMAVIARATDHYAVVFSWSEIFNSPLGDHVIVYFSKDGQPLGNDEGRIALISTDDLRTGPRHVRWLDEIELVKIVE